MKYATLFTAFAAAFLSSITAGGAVDYVHFDGARASEERLLGSNDNEARFRTYQPFIRQIAASGFVTDSLEASLANEGVPAVAMNEARRALATSIDLDRDVRSGDGFYVRFEQDCTAEGASIGVGRMRLVELHTKAKGKIAIYRFRGPDNAERFWLANGRAASPPSMRLPLENATVASGFGLRSDPFGQPISGKVSIAKPSVLLGKPSLVASPARLKGGLQRASSPGLPRAASVAKNVIRINATASPRLERSLFMHEGVDLVALPGTPVYAAANGIIVGAAPNGGYGNWIQIQHRDKLATVYGHLLAFAPDIAPGKSVERGDLIGFVGSTGRSTGAHLHFEIRVDGKPVDPMTYQEIQVQELRGLDLERFNHQLGQSQDASMKRKALWEVSDGPGNPRKCSNAC
jgi:murein DD-endopeptidase MepM/ murein hydrolase activator NlpD